ncbi:hypothetical protein [Rhodanobacter sp. DHB23]|uniref:hypothetical protein n=1 Tax=Rhodanobacter sp. DHB23 TaxID=2775923 RepID=UPI0017860516|nr:hypothetical protein [Rhodanobacter sp. DHB23]MBD8871713.1 hypothetical protein [Rhodanobacter sp. DHB23]
MRLATIPHSHPRWLVAAMLAMLVLAASNGFGLARQWPGSGMPWYGRDAGYDRLLVVDRQADRLTVYDAASGRPLRQLDADAAAAMLARHEGRVFVISGDGTRGGSATPPSGLAANGAR